MAATLSAKIIERAGWHLNEFLVAHPALLEKLGIPLTVIDAFSTPGDTLMTATVCRALKQKFPRLRLNCVTKNPELLRYDPNIEQLNGPHGRAAISFWYYDIILRKDGDTDVRAPTLAKLGITEFDNRTQVFLGAEEQREAEARAQAIGKPIITINVQSREQVKVWFADRWQQLVKLLPPEYAIVQLGGDDEPQLEGTIRLAGKLTIRQSIAMQAQAKLHIGSPSLLMHSACGVNVPSVIIYGGRETPKNAGYAQNENLYVKVECSPCWIHDSRGGRCPNDMKCMRAITPEFVAERARARLAKTS